MMSKRKKQIIVLACFLMFVIGIVAVVFLRQEELLSTDYQESDKEDTIEYNGVVYRYNEHLSNYLFMGIDTTEPIESSEARTDAGQADAIYLISYDRVAGTVKCLAIPRDTMTNIRTISLDGVDLGISRDHINIQYAFGDGKEKSCQLMKEAVSSLLYGIPIQGYCSINMDGIAVAVKVIGGVELTVPDDSLETVDPKFTEGATVTITETDAEKFVRYRDINQAQSAIVRMNRQKAFMEAFVETAKKKADADTGLIVDVYDSLKPYMVTNMGTDIFAKLLEASYTLEDKIQDIPGEKIQGTDYDEYHVDETQLKELIFQVFYVEVQDD